MASAMRHNINLRDLPPKVTRSGLSKFLDVSLATIDRWVEKGRIPRSMRKRTRERPPSLHQQQMKRPNRYNEWMPVTLKRADCSRGRIVCFLRPALIHHLPEVDRSSHAGVLDASAKHYRLCRAVVGSVASTQLRDGSSRLPRRALPDR